MTFPPRRSLSSAVRTTIERLESRRLLSISLFSAVSTPISSTPTGDPAAPVIADFDGDDKLDVLIAFPSPSAIDAGFIQFGKGDGAGTFLFSAAADVGIFTGRPVVGDFNGDDILDIAVTNAFGGEVKVIRGNGNGTFGAIAAFAAGVSPEPLAAGDFNDDGLTDLVVGNRSSNTAGVYLGHSGTTLAAPTTINTGTDPASLAIADFNNDGKLDILVGASGGTGSPSGVLQVFAGSGDGSFNTSPIATAGPRGVTAVANIDGDSGPDVIVGVSQQNRADALVNNGNATFTLTPGSTGGAASKAAVAVDMDGDSAIDLVTAVSGLIEILPGVGNGAFGKAISFDAAGGSGPAAADVNGDGRADILTITATPAQATGRTLNVSLGQRTGPDLSIAITSTIPPAALTSQNGQITVRVTNNGNEKLSRETPIQLYASTDTTVDFVTDPLLKQSFVKLNLGVGKSRNIKLKFEHALQADVYHLIAQVDPGGTTGDLNLFDNTAIGSNTVNVAPAFIDLTGTISPAPASPVTTGTKVKMSMAVTNVGNILAKGRVAFVIAASTDTEADSSLDIPLTTKVPNFSIKPGQTKTIRFNFKMPTLTAGTYYFLGVIDQGSAFIDADANNNTMVGSPQVTVE